jgi:LCP family protein required for cell wall assembly
MNNFKRHNGPVNGRRSNTIDGFVRRPAQARPTLGFGEPTQKKIKKDNVGFNAPDGFHVRSRGGSSVPDGTKTGRRSIKKDELDMSLKEGKSSAPKLKEGGRFRSGLKRSFAGISVVVLLLGGFLTGYAWLKANQVFQGGSSALALECGVDPKKLEKEGDGRVNILLLGKGGPGHTAEDLTDTIMIASIDSCQKEIGLLSIPRDLYVKMPGDGSMKLNAVYATAKEYAIYQGASDEEAEKKGIEATEKVVEEVTGIPMHYYAMVDFEAFRQAIDTVGGVDINAKEELRDPTVAWENGWDPVLAEAGPNHFNGKQALLYARSRHGSARGDFDRSERQREILLALQEKVLTAGTFSNPVKLSQLFSAFGNHVQTNLSIDDIMALYKVVGGVEDHKVVSISLADPPNDFVTTDNIGGLSVVVPKDGTYDYAAIQRYVRNILRDGFLKKENASIIVLNGSGTAGVATEYAELLKGYGYNVTETGDAPSSDYTETVVVNLRGNDKKYTKSYLEKRLGTSATSKLPAGIDAKTADFVIIVGSNETSN